MAKDRDWPRNSPTPPPPRLPAPSTGACAELRLPRSTLQIERTDRWLAAIPQRPRPVHSDRCAHNPCVAAHAAWLTIKSLDADCTEPERLLCTPPSGVCSFLNALWHAGGLMGATEDEAFQMACGPTWTMPPEAIACGRLRLQINVATTRPAECAIRSFEQVMIGS